jgi:hypothetical protein
MQNFNITECVRSYYWPLDSYQYYHGETDTWFNAFGIALSTPGNMPDYEYAPLEDE